MVVAVIFTGQMPANSIEALKDDVFNRNFKNSLTFLKPIFLKLAQGNV